MFVGPSEIAFALPDHGPGRRVDPCADRIRLPGTSTRWDAPRMGIRLMPFLQVELDAIKEAQGVSGATGINLAQVLGGLNLLWAHCWQKRTEIVEPVQLAGFFFAPGVNLVEPMIAFGFLDRLSDGSLRVKGAEKYLRISQAQSDAAKRTNSGRQSGRSTERSTSALSPITDHRSPDQEDLIPEAEQNAINPAVQLQKLW